MVTAPLNTQLLKREPPNWPTVGVGVVGISCAAGISNINSLNRSLYQHQRPKLVRRLEVADAAGAELLAELQLAASPLSVRRFLLAA